MNAIVKSTTVSVENEVKRKSSFRNSSEKRKKKRVRFTDTAYPESTPFWRRLVTLVCALWNNTRVSVKTVFMSIDMKSFPSRKNFRRRTLNTIRSAVTALAQIANSELEELGEQLPRYRPDSIAALRRITRFTEPELKRLYRGFKAECPTGVVREDTFKLIYSQFFPQGANTAQYAHYVFNTLDQDRSGLLSFEEFVTGLSVLSRGSLEEKLRWTFSLYDINGDGCITKEEMTDIVTAIYDLMGRVVEPSIEDDIVQQKVERLFQKMDLNRDGVVTLDEFLDCCVRDEDITRSMGVFDSSF